MAQNTTNAKHGELLNIQSNVENNPKENSTLIEYEQIEGTPYKAVKTEEGWFLTIGNYKLTEPTKTLEETEEKLKTDQWHIMINTMVAINEIDRIRLNQPITGRYPIPPVDENPTP